MSVNTQGGSRMLLFVFGVSVILLLVGVSIYAPTVIHDYFSIYKVILGVACAGIAAMIPGFFNIRYKTWVRAGGALGVFTFIVLFVSPVTNFFSIRVVVQRADGKEIETGAIVIMYLGAEVREARIQGNNDAIFENIPIRYSNSGVKFKLKVTENLNLVNPDSLYRLQENKLIFLDAKLMLKNFVSGVVLYDDKPLEGVMVTIGRQSDTTDYLGTYSLVLPLDQLQDEQVISFYKRGLKLQRRRIFLQSLKEVDMIMEK
jgi:hypothetical protein